ncbi:MFS transporter [Phytoactinopolyspora limicola]|uniref:MFS transporter n=1 Tax=Phytoactinopolyspora limicola TaxID=2715536 RepID=UPI00140E4349|nr:MFS transporter [Phytoactinopolyspora limicola]
MQHHSHGADGPLLRDPDLRRYIGARFVSLAGSAVTFVVMPVLVYSLTGSATWTALVAVAEGIPYLLTGLWAGVVADRLPRKAIMVGADIAAALVLMSIPVAAWLDHLTAAHVLIVAFVAQTVFVFFDAANLGSLPVLVPRHRLPSANSVIAGGGTVVEATVPAITGLLLVLVSPATLLVVDAVTFMASALLVRSIVRPLNRARRGVTPRTRTAISEGVRFIVDHPILRYMTIIGFLVAYSGGSLVGILVVWADHNLGVQEGDWRLGFVFAAWGIGAVVGSVVMPRLVYRVGGVRTALICLPLSGAAGAMTAASGHWVLGMLAIAAWGAAYLVIAANSVTLRQQVTPEPLMSRVMTVGRMTSFGAGFPAGALTVGLLADRIDVGVALLVCQISIAVATAVAWLSPLRHAPRHLALPDDAPAESTTGVTSDGTKPGT